MQEGKHIDWRDWLAAFAVSMAWVALIRPGELDLPYWWDEADVYVPGSKWVAEHGLTVTPGIFPDDYSRGHPILLYWLAGVAFNALGPGPLVGHLVVLPFTVAALAFTYLLGAHVFGRRAGLAAAIALGTTPLFMSIGNMLLPELPLTALAVASLYAYAHKRTLWVIALGCAAVWIKETGVFCVAAISGAELWMALRTRERQRWIRGLLLGTPVLALVGFFVWQKVHAGYYVFPHHANLFADRPLDWSNLTTVWPSLLFWHGRWVLVLGALAALAFGRSAWPTPDDQPRVVVAMVLLVLANFVFFSKMFWLERYALPAHPGIVVLLSGALLWGVGKLPRARRTARFLPLLCAAAIGLGSMRTATAPDEEEHTFAYADAIASHLEAFEHVHGTVLTPWPMTIELRNPYLGYVDSPFETIHPRSHNGERVDCVLFAEHSWRADELRQEAQRQGMHRVDVFRVGVAQGLELWSR